MSGKSSKLMFKGDKESSKKKRRHRTEEEKAEKRAAEGNDQTWVQADKIEDLVGPLFITQPTEPPVCFTTDEFDRFIAYPLSNLQNQAPEPTIVQQVFVGQRVVGSTNGFAFKSSNGKYFSSDKFGVVECNSEAIGKQEEWRPVITDSGFAFESVHNKFLMIDEVAGGGLTIRADADDPGFCETFRVYCQARFKFKPKSKSKDKNSDESDPGFVKKYQSWQGGKIHHGGLSKREAKAAKIEGRLAEALLDQRSKGKADRYCK
ncbi:FRG1-like family-domain-containing protein [Sporodiniella umbellata]|nr:FRG1-like family-domain-containing protein [Sporodiniella umbellata]